MYDCWVSSEGATARDFPDAGEDPRGVGALEEENTWGAGGCGVRVKDQCSDGETIDVRVLVEEGVQGDGEMLDCWRDIELWCCRLSRLSRLRRSHFVNALDKDWILS